VVDRVGHYITHWVHQKTGVDCQVTRTYEGIVRQVVHFGSRNAYFSGGFQHVDPSNRVVFTWFHGSDADPNPDNQRMIRALPECVPRVEKVVTSSSIGKERLLGWGVSQSKIALIPLGVDLRCFRLATVAQRRSWRERLEVPEGAICIGSFQKDGNGWGEGLEPKLVKGPDIFLEAVRRLAECYPLFVLLTGPARGYVKRGLETLGLPYRHDYLRNYEDIVPYYHCLDLYLVTSRDEGGPEAVLESMATGVPVVSTRVGMAADLVHSGDNGYLVEVEDVDGLVAAAAQLIEHPWLRQQCIANGLATVQAYDWSDIAWQYYECVYKPLLQ